MSITSRLRTVVAGSLAIAVLSGYAFSAAVAVGGPTVVHQDSNYADQIAAADAKKKANDQKLADLQSQLEDTDQAIAQAAIDLQALQDKLPGVQKELATAQERLQAAVVQQQIVAEKLVAANAQDAAISQQIVDDESRVAQLKITIGVMARDQYMSEGADSSLSLVFGATSSRDFVDKFAAQHSASRVQTNALDEVQQIAATNRNRGARQEAVRAYIVDLKKQADALVVEADAARKIAQQKKDEIEKNLAAQEALKAQLDAQRAAAIAQTKKLEKAQDDLHNQILELIKKKLAEEAAQTPTPLGTGFLSFPTKVPYVTSSYGMRFHPILHYYRMHSGTDFRAYCGTPIYASAGGKVLWAKYLYGFGSQVMIDHGFVNGNSLMTSYNHLSKFAVKSGEYVSRGTIVGYAGSEGLSTGCHLHYEVYVNGNTVDPMSVLGPIP